MAWTSTGVSSQASAGMADSILGACGWEELNVTCCPADALMPSHLPYSAVTCYLQSTAHGARRQQVQCMAFSGPLHGDAFLGLQLRNPERCHLNEKSCMQGSGRGHSALVLCRMASGEGAINEQTICQGLQQRLMPGPQFYGMPQQFHNDQIYPEYIIQMAQ